VADEGKQELAKERTDLAEDRTLLANERTYAGWMRTGFASIAVGLGFQALFEMLKPPVVPKAIATAFLLIAIFVFVSAERRAAAMTKRFHPHEVKTFKLVNLRLITIAAVGATIALAAAIWILGP
jgi:putative membrane protein